MGGDGACGYKASQIVGTSSQHCIAQSLFPKDMGVISGEIGRVLPPAPDTLPQNEDQRNTQGSS